MVDPIVISFYTVETEGKRLIDSCVELGIEADIVGVAPEVSKPFFILQKLKEWNRPVLWVDAHATFKQRPNFQDFASCDFAVRLNEFLPKNHALRVISNTVFVRNNQAGILILEEWCKKDQPALSDALDRFPKLKFFPLPLKYAKTFDFDNLFISDAEVVIEHQQQRKVHILSQSHCCR